MTWRPGQRVITEQDRAAWKDWRNERQRIAMRARRVGTRRIEYYPNPAADDAIRDLKARYGGRDLSSVINAIVSHWSALAPHNRVAQER